MTAQLFLHTNMSNYALVRHKQCELLPTTTKNESDNGITHPQPGINVCSSHVV